MQDGDLMVVVLVSWVPRRLPVVPANSDDADSDGGEGVSPRKSQMLPEWEEVSVSQSASEVVNPLTFSNSLPQYHWPFRNRICRGSDVSSPTSP